MEKFRDSLMAILENGDAEMRHKAKLLLSGASPIDVFGKEWVEQEATRRFIALSLWAIKTRIQRGEESRVQKLTFAMQLRIANAIDKFAESIRKYLSEDI